MFESTIIRVAEAVVSQLNSRAFTYGFEAQAEYAPEFDLADLDNPKVTVVIPQMQQSILTRGGNQKDVTVQIALQKRLQGIGKLQVDQMVRLLEEIGDYLSGEECRRLATYSKAQWLATEYVALSDTEHLRTKSVYTGVLSVTYRVM